MFFRTDPAQPLRTAMRVVGLVLATAVAFGGTVVANAAVTPGNGATAGGTSVQLETAREKVSYTQMFAGLNHTVAIGSDGHTYTSGRNDFGQLGNGSKTNSSIPRRVSTPLHPSDRR